MRDLKELLTILRDSLAEGDKVGYWNTGICGEIINLQNIKAIKIKERSLLFLYITSQRPANICGCDSYWWPVMNENPEYRQVRIDYIDELINKLQ